MSSLEEVSKFILAASKDELEELSEVLRRRNSALAIESSMSFVPGNEVWFDAKRRGIIHGTIIKMNLKSAKVKAKDGMVWNVTPALLHKVAKP